jgi:hypothetical protein
MRQKGFASVILLIIVIVGVIGGLVYLNSRQIINNNKDTDTNPTPTYVLPVGNPSLFQTVLYKDCITIPFQSGGSNNYIDPDKLPIRINKWIIDSIEDPFNDKHQVNCTLASGQHTGDAGLVTKNKVSVKIYDDNTFELGHGGYSEFESFDTIVDNDNTTELSIKLSSNGPGHIGEISIVLRGEKEITLKNGEIVNVNATTTAISEDDPRLIELLTPYTRPVDYDQNLKQINWELISSEKLEGMIKERFFNMNKLRKTESDIINEIETILSGITAK